MPQISGCLRILLLGLLCVLSTGATRQAVGATVPPESARCFGTKGLLWGRTVPMKGGREGKGAALKELERLASVKAVYTAEAHSGKGRPAVAAAFQGVGRRRGGGGQGGDRSWWQAALSDGLRNGCASGMAAACAKLLLQPFDTVKTVQQATRGSLGMVEAGRQLVARKGVGALYSGLGITLVGSIPAVSVYFGVYQYTKTTLLGMLPKQIGWSLFGIAVSAGIGNTVASVFRVPYEVVKQRLQAGVYATTREALVTMYTKEGGMAAFFGRGGVTSQILRDVPYAIITLLTYETLHKMRRDYRRKQAVETQQPVGTRRAASSLEDSLVGAIAGGVGTFFSNPMDVVKTRVMTQPHLYTGVADALIKTYRGEGASAFFKGSVPRLMHKIPANAIFFAAYELFRRLLKVSNT